MLDKEKTQIKVGIFVVVGLLLGMYIIFMIGGEKQLFESQYRLTTQFKDISGLRNGAPIQLAGLKIGFVDKIKFSEDLTKKDIELTLRINKKFQERIRKDSIATVNTQGLLGDKFIYISVGSDSEEVLKNGDFLEGKEVYSIYNLAEKSGEIVEDVKEASKSIRKFFEEMYTGKDDVRQAIRSVKNIMKEAENGNGVLHALVYDPKGKQVVEDIAASIGALKDIMGRVNETDKKNGEISGIITNLKLASADFKEVVERINRGEGTIGGLVTDPAIYNDLRSLFGRANRNKLLKAVVRSTLEKNDNQ